MPQTLGAPSPYVQALLHAASGADLVAQARAVGATLNEVVEIELESQAGSMVLAERIHPEDALDAQTTKAAHINRLGLEAQVNCLLVIRGRAWLEQHLQELASAIPMPPAAPA